MVGEGSSELSFVPRASGLLLVDCSLNVAGGQLLARGLLHVNSGPASKAVAFGPALTGVGVSQPSSLFVSAADKAGNPTVMLNTDFHGCLAVEAS